MTRPGIKVIDFVNVPRRSMVASRTHFSSREEIAICIRGFAGRTVHIELWEQQHGRVRIWDETIPPPRVERRGVGATYENYAGTGRAVSVRDDVQTELDWVIRLNQVPPGNYEVRLTSQEGLQQNASFVVTN
jgi:hypothetical protein